MSEERKMIQELIRWYNSNSERFQTDDLAVNLRRNSLATVEQVGIDVETPHVLASFNLWGWGDLEVIVVCKRSHETLVADDLKLSSPLELSTTLDCYYHQIRSQEQC
jgi:hypothetical protein